METNKRTASRAQLLGLGSDIDLVATAKALVDETADPSQVNYLYTLSAPVKRRMLNFEAAVTQAKLDKYGRTFVCDACKKELSVNRRMSGHSSDYTPVYSQPCSPDVCYDCAMANPTKCPRCHHSIHYWEDGPVPHVIVVIYKVKSYVADYCGTLSFHRFEFDPATTKLRQVKEAVLPLIPAEYKFSSFEMPCVVKPLLDKTLCEQGEPGDVVRITVNVKRPL